MKRTLRQRFAEEHVYFGGIVASRRAFIDAMQADGASNHEIDQLFAPWVPVVEVIDANDARYVVDHDGQCYVLSPVAEDELPGGDTVPEGAACPVVADVNQPAAA